MISDDRAIEILEIYKKNIENSSPNILADDVEAFNMAINAIKEKKDEDRR